MPRLLCLLVAAMFAVGCIPSRAAHAQKAIPAIAAKHASSKKKAHSVAKPSMGAFGISNSLNAPSTDFSHVTTQNNGEETRGPDGPLVRPSIGSDGNPVMGLGF